MAAAISMAAAHIDDYERKLRIKLTAWMATDEEQPFAEELLLLPDLLGLAARLLLDDEVPAHLRPALLGAVMYVVSPTDLLPERLLGVAGLADDLVLSALVIDEAARHLSPALLARYWQAEKELPAAVAGVLDRAEEMLGERLLERLRAWSRGE